MRADPSEMHQRPLPSTVGLILHFRGWQQTATCLKSLVAEGIEEIVVVDNSEDSGKSLRELEQNTRHLVTDSTQIVFIEPGRNLGFAAGVNRGLEEIRARFGPACVLLINSDAFLHTGAHDQMRAKMHDHGGLVVPDICEGARCGRGRAHYQIFLGVLTRQRLPGSFPYFSGCCMMFSPQLASEPAFDEDFFFYGDDWELGWRLLQNNTPRNIAFRAKAGHEPSSSSKNGSVFYEYHMVRAHWLLADKLSDDRLSKIVRIIGRMLTLPARAVWRSVKTSSLTPIRGATLATLDFLFGRCRKLTPPADASQMNREAPSSRQQP